MYIFGLVIFGLEKFDNIIGTLTEPQKSWSGEIGENE